MIMTCPGLRKATSYKLVAASGKRQAASGKRQATRKSGTVVSARFRTPHRPASTCSLQLAAFTCRLPLKAGRRPEAYCAIVLTETPRSTGVEVRP
ncbi:hypothetical protein GKC70_04870 [Pseudomonas sp. REB1044]